MQAGNMKSIGVDVTIWTLRGSEAYYGGIERFGDLFVSKALILADEEFKNSSE